MRLPGYVHEANVAGLNKPVKIAKAKRVDNIPTVREMADKINACERYEDREMLFFLMPIEMQDEVMPLLHR